LLLRQLLTYGVRETPESICNKVDLVTADDIQRIVRKAMKNPPSLVFSGDLSLFPEYKQVCDAISEGLKLSV